MWILSIPLFLPHNYLVTWTVELPAASLRLNLTHLNPTSLNSTILNSTYINQTRFYSTSPLDKS